MPDCEHPTFTAKVHVDRLVDKAVLNFMAEVSIECKQCGAQFSFTGLRPGSSPTRPTTDISGKTARLPIKPAEDKVIKS